MINIFNFIFSNKSNFVILKYNTNILITSLAFNI